MTDNNAATIARALLNIKAVSFSVDPPFTWTSGIQQPIYTDNRLLLSHVNERKVVVQAFLDLIKKKGIYCDGIAATATAGISWGAWIADALDKPLIYVRGSAKGHGKQNTIEGHVERDKIYLIVEDLISTGKSSLHTANAVRQAGALANDVLAIFSYGFETAKEQFEQQRLQMFTLTDVNHLLTGAFDLKLLKESEQQTMNKWKENPLEWKP